MYLDKITKHDLREFILTCRTLNMQFDEAKFENIALSTIKYLNGDKDARNQLRVMQELENHWYASLEAGEPDYSVYDNVYYLADCWVCWKKYSREYIKSIISEKSLAAKDDHNNWYNLKSIRANMGAINKIADLGCGTGYTCAAFKELFTCPVYGTNIKDTNQWKICERIAQETGFILTDKIENVGNADMVFASEYFEHFERPVEHLREVLTTLKPKHFLFANTFNAKSIGHFNIYKDQDKDYTGKEIARLFAKTLRDFKYTSVETNCWNKRPNYYIYEG